MDNAKLLNEAKEICLTQGALSAVKYLRYEMGLPLADGKALTDKWKLEAEIVAEQQSQPPPLKVYQIVENYQDMDPDVWTQWVGHTYHSIHATEEGAANKIVTMLNGEENAIFITVDDGYNPSKTKEYPIYQIIEHEVEP